MGMLWLNRQRQSLRRLVLLFTAGVLVLAHYQLWEVRNDVSMWSSYRAFIAGMLIWAWHELAFYSGVLAGPWRKACPSDARGFRRLYYAILTHLYHIAAIGADMLVLWLMHNHSPNQTGLYLFILLWINQLSAKLNVLLGVRNFEATLLPDHMRYLSSFWNPSRCCHPFFLVSLVTTVLIALFLWTKTILLAGTSNAIGMSFLATVATMGAFEHLLLVLPVGAAHESRVEKRELAGEDG